MAKFKKFNTSKIKEEAEKTLANYHRQRGDGPALKNGYAITVAHIRIYTRKVLFLCKEIEKLEKKK